MKQIVTITGENLNIVTNNVEATAAFNEGSPPVTTGGNPSS